MRRLPGFLLLSVFSLGLAGCGGDDTTVGDSGDTETDADTDTDTDTDTDSDTDTDTDTDTSTTTIPEDDYPDGTYAEVSCGGTVSGTFDVLEDSSPFVDYDYIRLTLLDEDPQLVGVLVTATTAFGLRDEESGTGAPIIRVDGESEGSDWDSVEEGFTAGEVIVAIHNGTSGESGSWTVKLRCSDIPTSELTVTVVCDGHELTGVDQYWASGVNGTHIYGDYSPTEPGDIERIFLASYRSVLFPQSFGTDANCASGTPSIRTVHYSSGEDWSQKIDLTNCVDLPVDCRVDETIGTDDFEFSMSPDQVPPDGEWLGAISGEAHVETTEGGLDVTIDVQWSNEGVRYVSWSDDYDIFNTTDSN